MTTHQDIIAEVFHFEDIHNYLNRLRVKDNAFSFFVKSVNPLKYTFN